MTAARALLDGRCPRCRDAGIYGPLGMHKRCPACGMLFDREPGYFVASMYFSYAISVPLVLVLFLLIWWLAGIRYQWALACAGLAFLPFVPRVIRISRIAWIHLDHMLDPQKPAPRSVG